MHSSNYKVQPDASSTFGKKVKKLAKRFRNIEKDLQKFYSAIEENHRQKCGAAPVPDFRQSVWKYRCQSTDLKRGQSGGYRIICYVDSVRFLIYPITIYAKSDQSNISASEIQKLVEALYAEIDIQGSIARQ